MQIAVYGRKLKPSASADVKLFFDILQSKGIGYTIYSPFHKHLVNDHHLQLTDSTFTKKKEITEHIDFIFSLGGDGTILDAVSWIGEKEIPIVGINFGRLGFLASISIGNIENAINAILNNQHVIDSRNMIALESNKKLFGSASFALNEFTVQRTETSSMITVHTYLDGLHLNSYWADGLIVSTPTGSTGYSLSCGGPVIYPSSNNFVITPVAPHNLNVRPMVVPDNIEIKLLVEGRSKRFLATLDSRNNTIDASFELILKKAKFQAKLVRLSDSNFVQAIREKLLWGEDLRN
jgi:NAD+ kinase